jgi:branched-chain amino acid transport system substrate-binding protein
MKTTIRNCIILTAIATSLPAFAQVSGNVVKLGLINDQSGPFSAMTGPGSAVAAQMAIEDMASQLGGIKVELLVADHQNKPDVGLTVAKRWIDVDGVDALLDIANSAVGLAIQSLGREKNRIVMYGPIGTTELTGKQCSPVGFSWLHDSHALVSGPVQSLSKAGLKNWYFIGADFAFGRNMVLEAKTMLEPLGGKTVGEAYHPMGSSDYSSYLLKAYSSNAQVVAFANGGAQLVNAMKQWKEFGMADGKKRPVGLLTTLADVHGAGLDIMQGLSATTAWYWDRDDKSRAFGRRFFERFKAMPTESQASIYSATSHYLKAVAATKSDDTNTVAAWMKRTPVNDMYATNAVLRADGKLMHDFLQVTVKTKAESKEPWDYYRIDGVVAAKDAFITPEQSDCPLFKEGASK